MGKLEHESVAESVNPGAGEILVLVADRHPVFRQGVAACLGETPDIRVAGQAAGGGEMAKRLAQASYHVMLLDADLPGLAGFSLLKQVKDDCPSLRILLMASVPDIGWLLRGVRAGASGMVTKEAMPVELEAAIRRIHAGEPYMAEPLARKMVLFHQRQEQEPLDERLSPREFEVMRRLSQGLKLSEIARKLQLSHQTITTHRRHILEKTGLRTTAEIIRFGVLNGLGDPDESEDA